MSFFSTRNYYYYYLRLWCVCVYPKMQTEITATYSELRRTDFIEQTFECQPAWLSALGLWGSVWNLLSSRSRKSGLEATDNLIFLRMKCQGNSRCAVKVYRGWLDQFWLEKSRMAAWRWYLSWHLLPLPCLHSWEEEVMFVFASLHLDSGMKFPPAYVKFWVNILPAVALKADRNILGNNFYVASVLCFYLVSIT